MIERPGTWGEVTTGTTLLSPTEAPLLILQATPSAKTGKLWYQARDHAGRVFTIKPKLSDAPVTLLESTPEEAILVAEGLPATHVLDMERERRMPERAKRWIVPPLASKGRGALDKIRDHISWYHGTYTTDLRTLKQAAEAHAEMHDPDAVGGLFMDMPHTHKGD